MHYLKVIVLAALLAGCGNDSYYEKKEQFRLLNAQESNKIERVEKNTSEKSTIREERVQHEEHSEPTIDTTVAVDIEKNTSIVTPVTEVLFDQNRSEEKNATAVSSFDEEMTQKNFTLETELKKLEMEQKGEVIANEKEIALAKLENEKLIAQEKISIDHKKTEIEAQNQKELELAKLESQKAISQNEKEVAQEKSLHEKEIALAKLETEKVISEKEQKLAQNKAVNEKELALAKLEIEKEQKEQDMALYKIITAVVAGLVILILLIIYLMHRRNKSIELKLHEEELLHQKYLEASKQHNENLKKMLEIVTDEKTDKGIKKEIVRLLKDQGKQSNLIEHKK